MVDRKRTDSLSSGGWTIDTLKALMDERDHIYTERDHARRKEVESAFMAAKEAMHTAITTTEKAAQETKAGLNEYKVTSNEWRDTVKDLVGRMPSRMEIEVIERNILDKIRTVEAENNLLRQAMAEGAGKGEGVHAMWGYIVQAITLVAAVVGTYIVVHAK